MKTICGTCLAALIAVSVAIALDLVVKGASGLHWTIWWGTPTDLGRAGGLGSILANTLLVVGGGVGLAAAPALATAICLTEPRLASRRLRAVAFLIDIGVGMPRVTWGLFGLALFGHWLGLGVSSLTGILTLACLLAPILVQAISAGLRSVPRGLREQCAALGLTPWDALRTQVLPAAAPALRAAFMLAVGRGLGDAAALMFTAGLATSLATSWRDSAATLAVHCHHLLTAVPGGAPAAYTTALVLLGLSALIQTGVMLHAKTGEGIP